MQPPVDKGCAGDADDDRHAQGEVGEEVQYVVEPEGAINIDWRERVGIHADSRLVVALADDLPGALISEARNDHAILEKSPDRSTYGSAISPSKITGVNGVPLELVGAVGCVGAANLTVTVRLRFGATAGLGVTGIAGPGGGTPDKPVGTVHLALDVADGTRHHERLVLPGDRIMVRRWTTSAALAMIRGWLMERGGTV